jgi:hypothetical protein
MERYDGFDRVACPHLMPKVVRRAGGFPAPASVYCRLPNGRVRVPSRDQVASLCTSGQYFRCTGYRRWERSWTASGGDA